MKNPPRKRILRELRDELGKYLVIFLLLTATIGFVSGFLVADGSMLAAYEEGFSFYNIEDGYFDLAQKANKAQVKTIQGWGVQLYENFYVEKPLTNGSTLRVFAPREQVDRVCLMSGSLPQTADEVAIDRMYADNNGLAPGDTLETEDGRRWTVSGLVALSDYSCLFSDNNDSMFDSVKFILRFCRAYFQGRWMLCDHSLSGRGRRCSWSWKPVHDPSGWTRYGHPDVRRSAR